MRERHARVTVSKRLASEEGWEEEKEVGREMQHEQAVTKRELNVNKPRRPAASRGSALLA